MTKYIGQSASAATANLDANPHPTFAAKDPSAMRFAGSPFYDATHPTYGAQGTVGHDNRAALFAANAAVGANGILQLLPDVASYEVASDLTIDCAHFRPTPGARLKATNGAKITFKCTIDECSTDFLDFTGTGTFDFSQCKARAFKPRWFGASGLGIVDDSVALTRMMNVIPDQARVELPQGAIYNLFYIWMGTYRTGITFMGSNGMPFDDYGSGYAPRFKWSGIAGGTALGFYSCGSITFLGCVFDFQNAAMGLDYDSLYLGFTNGNTALTSNANGGGGPVVGAGPAFFRSLPPNCDIWIAAGALGGGVFHTTLSAVADNTHATLAAAPTGVTSASGSASFGQAGVASGQRICTRLRLFGCHFRCSALVDCALAANSKTSQNNGEYPQVVDCKFSGGGLQTPNIPQNGGGAHRGNFNFGNFDGTSWAAPGGQILVGTNVFAGFTVDTFSASMDQMPIWIVGAGTSFCGPNGDGVSAGSHQSLFGYVKWTGNARSIQITATPGGVNLNAINTSAVGGAFAIGRAFGTGFLNGPSANAKRCMFFNNEFENLQYGIDCQGGSLRQMDSNFADLDCNVRTGGAMSESSSEWGTNTENSRQHLLHSGGQSYTIYPGRYAFVYARAGNGFFEWTGSKGGFKIDPSGFDNHLPTGAAVFDLHHVAGQGVELIGGKFPYIDGSVVDKTGYLGVNNLPEGTYVHQVGCQAGVAFFADEEVYNNLTNSGAADGSPMRIFGGSTFLAGTNIEPADGNFKYIRLAVLWFKNSFGWKLLAKQKAEDGNYYMHELPRCAIPLALVDAANITPNMAKNRFFTLVATAGVGVNRQINAPTGGADGEVVMFNIKNSTGGAIVTAWAGFFMPAWVDPANGKMKTVMFYWNQGALYQMGAPSADY